MQQITTFHSLILFFFYSFSYKKMYWCK